MIGLFAGIPDWMLDGFGTLFIQLLDRMMYIGLANMYAIFKAVAGLNIFGTEGGSKIFSEISHRVYNVIFIIAIFMISYSILTYIINPEKNNEKMIQGTGVTFKNILFSIVLVIMCPLAFKYMAIFQEHVLTENTIGAIIAGTGTAEETQWGGKGLAASVYMSVFHPTGTDYTTFYEIDGAETKLKDEDEAIDLCTDECDEEIDDESLCEKTCEEYYAALEDTEDSMDEMRSVVGTLATQSLIYKIADGSMEYLWVLATIMGWLVAWFFASYAIDLGVRAVKLGVLQLIAPVPILMKPFQKPGGMYEKWSKELIKCYVEVFARLVIVFFVVEMFKLIPTMLSALFDADNNLKGASKYFAFIILILGLLKFAKEAPDLFKQIFSSGGNWLSGLNLKPGVRKRIEDNDYAMKGLSTAAGALSGAAAGMMKAMKDHKDNNGTTGGASNTLGRLGAGVVGAARGIVHGGATGWDNSTKDLSQMGEIAKRGRGAAHQSVVDAQNKSDARKQRLEENKSKYYEDNGITASNASVGQKIKANIHSLLSEADEGIGKAGTRVGEGFQNVIKDYRGENGVADYTKVNALEAAAQAANNLNAMQDNRIKEFNDQCKAEKDKLRSYRGSNTTAYVGDKRHNFTYKKAGSAPGIEKDGWYADDNGVFKSYDQLANEERINRLEKAGFSPNDKQYIKESISQMTKALKNVNMDAEDWNKIAEKMVKTGAIDANRIDKDSSGKYILDAEKLQHILSENIATSEDNKDFAKALLAVKAAGGQADKLASREKASISTQQAVNQTAKDADKKDNK